MEYVFAFFDFPIGATPAPFFLRLTANKETQ